MADAPHFAFPMTRAAGGAVATVEQDTIDDVEACVLAVVYVHTGEVDGSPDLGHPDWTFMQQPIGRNEIAAQIVASEPRAELLVSEAPDRFDALLDRIEILVAG